VSAIPNALNSVVSAPLLAASVSSAQKILRKAFLLLTPALRKAFLRKIRLGEDIWKISVRKADAQRFTTLRQLRV